MILRLIGHDYKYAVEQVLLTLFPEERPVYEDVDEISSVAVNRRGGQTPCVPTAEIRLSHGPKVSTAVTELWYEGVWYRGVAKVARPEQGSGEGKNRVELVYARQMQKIIKLSFYRAATTATGIVPPWGALTGEYSYFNTFTCMQS